MQVRQNNSDAVEQLLDDGVSPDVHDEATGGTCLHLALIAGSFRIAALLLEAGAQVLVQDAQGRTVLDSVSLRLKEFLAGSTALEGNVYTWGNGANYQLGTGGVGLQLSPVRLEGLRGIASVNAIHAAKFHSVANTRDGQLYTWGFGRGGRLGSHIYSGQSAAILPQQVTFFARRHVVRVAAAKHHAAAVTASGELFTWGSNRDGRLGYQSVDTQPTPRKITNFNRQRVIDVAAANRHTVALLDCGSVYSWGSNLQGQLGYGTAHSASNALPRILEALKGKTITAVAAAKRHTLALTSDGEVYTWGHQIVTPKRIILSAPRDEARANARAAGGGGGWQVVFHNGEAARREAVLIAAGAAHSAAVTRCGAVLAWRSMDPALRAQEVGGRLAGAQVVAISAGKYRTAAVTDEGDVYMWEGWSKAAEAVPKRAANPLLQSTSPSDVPPQEWEVSKGLKQKRPGKAKALAFQLITPKRVDGLKRVTGVAVGEKHSIALQSWCVAPRFFAQQQPAPPASPVAGADSPQSPRTSEAGSADGSEAAAAAGARGQNSLRSDAYWEELDQAARACGSRPSSATPTSETPPRQRLFGSAKPGPASLQRLCERRVAESIVEPRSVLQILEYADAAGAGALRMHCLAVALSNLDLVILESRTQFEQLPPHILDELGRFWESRIENSLRCGSAASSCTLEATRHASAGPHSSNKRLQCSASPRAGAALSQMAGTSTSAADSELGLGVEAVERAKQVRTVQKKLQQIDALQQRAPHRVLDGQQLAKVATRPSLMAALQALQEGRPLADVNRLLAGVQGSAGTSKAPDTMQAGAGSVSQDARRRSRRHRSSNSGSGVSAGRADLPSEQRMQPSDASSAADSSSSRGRVLGSLSSSMAVHAALPTSVRRVAGFAKIDSPELPGPNASPRAQPVIGSQADTVADTPRIRPSSGSTVGEDSERGHSPALASHAMADRSSLSAAKKPVKRKGGLSLFLTGQLEEPKQVASSPPPKSSPLTWAIQAQSTPATSMRQIFDEEAASSTAALSHRRSDKTSRPAGTKNMHPPSARGGQASPAGSVLPASIGGLESMTVSLGDLVKKSKPIAVTSTSAPPAVVERGNPAWGALPGGSPAGSTTRLQDIQAEQEQVRESVSRSWTAMGASPVSVRGGHAAASGTAWRSQTGTSPGAAFPSGTSPVGSYNRRSQQPAPLPHNKWYIKEELEIVPLRCIQTEESAIKELAELYGAPNVRIASDVKPNS